MTFRIYGDTGARLLTVIDENSKECLAIRAARSIRSADVIEVLAELMVTRGVPDHIRSDIGPEFTARAVRGFDLSPMFVPPVMLVRQARGQGRQA